MANGLLLDAYSSRKMGFMRNMRCFHLEYRQIKKKKKEQPLAASNISSTTFYNIDIEQKPLKCFGAGGAVSAMSRILTKSRPQNFRQAPTSTPPSNPKSTQPSPPCLLTPQLTPSLSCASMVAAGTSCGASRHKSRHRQQQMALPTSRWAIRR